jgi:tetratricopeptide (TPR) repeat protein
MLNNLLAAILMLLPVVATFFGIRKFIREIRKPARSYAFNRKDIEKLTVYLNKAAFQELEDTLKALSPEDLTLALDNLSLTSNEKQILKIKNKSNQSPVFELLHGIWHLHEAWKKRGHSLASDLTEKQVQQFIDHLKSACQCIETALIDSKLSVEAHSRLIRAYMSMGYGDTAKEHFHQAIAANPKHFWSYIHYAELIQSKWFGSEEEVRNFYKKLPQNDAIKMGVKLKLLNDGILTEENYFDIFGEHLDEEIDKILNGIDAELAYKTLPTTALYLIFGYIYVLCPTENKGLRKKYEKLIRGNYALYPFGYL